MPCPARSWPTKTATFEAIHSAAHPGRTSDADDADATPTTDADAETSDEEATT